MFCPNCGTEFPEDAQFCMKCGTKRPQSQPEPEPATGLSQDQGKNHENVETNKARQETAQQPQQRKPVREMTEEELLADGKARIKRAVRNVIIGLIGFGIIIFIAGRCSPDSESSVDDPDLSTPSMETMETSSPVTPTEAPATDRYTISYESGEAFASAFSSNEARYLALHEGETIRINYLEITGISGYSVYSYVPGYTYIYMDFKNDSDLYSIDEGALVTIDAVVSKDLLGSLRLSDCVLIDVENNEYGYIDDVMSSEYGTHSKMDESSTIGFSVYTGEGSGFILTYYGADATASNLVFSVSTPYSNSNDDGSVIYFYDSLGNGLILTVVSPGTISISCDSSTFEGISSSTLDGTYYMTESYINPMA